MNNEVIRLPLITLRGMTILPRMVIRFDISRKKSIKAVESMNAEPYAKSGR